MSIDDRFIEQTQAQIKAWNHELLELQARVKRGDEDADQMQVCKQRIIELESQRDAAEKQIQQLQKS